MWGKSLLVFAVIALATLPVVSARSQTPSTAAVGDAQRGKDLFATTYRCYACHGFKGETTAPATPRLVPMARTREAFITYLRKPATAAMPTYSKVPEKDLSDIYVYLRSVQTDAAPVESIPLLNNLLTEIKKRP
jgi:mono/diheme cytochrome c family protein